MSDRDQYLWDGSGRPDPDVVRLEELLAPLGQGAAGRAAASPKRTRPRLWLFGLATAAALTWLLAGLLFDEWPARGDLPLFAGEARLATDELFVAPAGRTSRLRLAEIGELSLAPGTRLRARSLDREEVVFELERGALSAYVSPSASPGFFNIDTPATRCVDLGCAYELEVAEDGATLVQVTLGRVAFRGARGEVFVPAGALCRATRERGEGTPYFPESPRAWLAELERFDTLTPGSAARRDSAAKLLEGVRGEPEALPLWHLAGDVDGRIAEPAARRLAALRGLPAELEATGPVALGDEQRERWRDYLWPDPYGK